ncbi:hypothetical protein, partial [Ornithinimicrobium sp. Y1694]|uniref:hypothetical protein n=1 Tax=Ornithinimicrobium sp. Y1694 TaxID=3418590 RepID=UPI003CF53B1B
METATASDLSNGQPVGEHRERLSTLRRAAASSMLHPILNRTPRTSRPDTSTNHDASQAIRVALTPEPK